ncbi:uncharacterized protein BJX67DRAFT_368722 [Aspergillus lucknowensis]|uniref:Uncharacterized protein n=1 Tax=Aspergillus lucknowensis TaxID=176173 RepID=A0ABR4L5K1_9EURO
MANPIDEPCPPNSQRLDIAGSEVDHMSGGEFDASLRSAGRNYVDRSTQTIINISYPSTQNSLDRQGQPEENRKFPVSYNGDMSLGDPKSASKPAQIKANTSRKRDGSSSCRPAVESQKHGTAAVASCGDSPPRRQIAAYGSTVANAILLMLQLYAAMSSGSPSLFTIMVDTIFNQLSIAMRSLNPSRFSSDYVWLKTASDMAFSFLKSVVSLISMIIIIAFTTFDPTINGTEGSTYFYLPSVIALITTFVSKLMLFLYFWDLKDRYPDVRILWQDHRNALLINGFGILMSIGGARVARWIDPAGAILLSFVVFAVWLHKAFAEFILLVSVKDT